MFQVGLWIDAGSRFETEKNNGVAHFLEHMAFKVNETAFSALALPLRTVVGKCWNGELSARENSDLFSCAPVIWKAFEKHEFFRHLENLTVIRHILCAGRFWFGSKFITPQKKTPPCVAIIPIARNAKHS